MKVLKLNDDVVVWLSVFFRKINRGIVVPRLSTHLNCIVRIKANVIAVDEFRQPRLITQFDVTIQQQRRVAAVSEVPVSCVVQLLQVTCEFCRVLPIDEDADDVRRLKKTNSLNVLIDGLCVLPLRDEVVAVLFLYAHLLRGVRGVQPTHNSLRHIVALLLKKLLKPCLQFRLHQPHNALRHKLLMLRLLTNDKNIGRIGNYPRDVGARAFLRAAQTPQAVQNVVALQRKFFRPCTALR
ncbi:hypothetical protein C3747_103g32 [Trypanosoma cruzi]|uniref:Uncharacterized protein n=1 Tax=Trypanosoma cruzi TaxID=5693 RepID=A0A2V2WL88_TRYCR|nr:hypothetical protein C3747_103g32 [Trypanosoma cruzi]